MEYFEDIDMLLVEEEAEMYNYINPVRKERVVKERPDHFSILDANEFYRRFRLKKDTVQYLLSLVENKLRHQTDSNQCVSPLLQVLAALRFYATGSFYITVGDFAGLHSSTLCVIINKVTSVIASLRQTFVHLPRNQEETRTLQEEFYNIARFPRVVAAIDCTHIRNQSPGGDTAENFRNRKGFFSLNVQAMCTANLKIQDIVARWPGSTHDSLIFHNSAAKYLCDSGLFGNGIILGDSGYFLNNYLITPLNDPQTPAQRLYNESHIRTRNVIERCFGVWKRRFPVLRIGMRCKLALVQDVIVATAVLHNLAIMRNDEEPPSDPDVHIPPQQEFLQLQADGEEIHSTRDMLLEYFSSLL